MVNFKSPKFLLLTPLVLATTVAFANWGADSEETSIHNATANDEDRAAFIDLTKMVAAGDLEGAQNQVIDAATDQGVGFTKSFLEKYFPTVELSFDTQGGSKPTSGILVVAPLSDESDIKNTVFTQLSAFYQDNRTTLNAGLGYRRLAFDNTLMLGVNAFYDHEFPYDHGRTSIGFEARTTMGEINANKYWATTKDKVGKQGFTERALDGYDIEGGIALPYMNWATVFVKHSKWNSEIADASDLRVNEVSLRARVPVLPGLEIEGGRKYNSGAITKDESFFMIQYNLTAALSEKPKRRGWTSKNAYELSSMEDRRYEKVRRQNLTVKQISAPGSVTVTGF